MGIWFLELGSEDQSLQGQGVWWFAAEALGQSSITGVLAF